MLSPSNLFRKRLHVAHSHQDRQVLFELFVLWDSHKPIVGDAHFQNLAGAALSCSLSYGNHSAIFCYTLCWEGRVPWCAWMLHSVKQHCAPSCLSLDPPQSLRRGKRLTSEGCLCWCYSNEQWTNKMVFRHCLCFSIHFFRQNYPQWYLNLLGGSVALDNDFFPACYSLREKKNSLLY